MNTQKHSGTQEVMDMERHCVRCGTRLYIPMSQAGAVLASLGRCKEGLIQMLVLYGIIETAFLTREVSKL